MKHEMTLFHTMDPKEMFYSRLTFFLWPYMVLCDHLLTLTQDDTEQDCIPLGCIPPAHWSYLPACSGQGRCLLPGGAWSQGSTWFGGGALVPWGCLLLGGGGAWSQGVCTQWGAWSGGCLLPGGVCSGGVPVPRGMPVPRGVCAPEGVPVPRGCPPGGCLVLGGVCSRGWYPGMHWGRPPLWTESQLPVKI